MVFAYRDEDLATDLDFAIKNAEPEESLRQPADDREGLLQPAIEETKPTNLAGASVLALATAACGGGDSPNSTVAGPGTGPVVEVRAPTSDAEAARFLLQASFAASQSAIEQLKRNGYEPWLDGQMAQTNSQTARSFFSDRGFDQVDENDYFNSDRIADQMIWSQLLSGGSSVRKRVALALSEFFVVSINNLAVEWPGPAIGEYWDILNRNAFGSFRELVEEITLNPAMGVFLNTRGNRKANPNTGRVPDENYGREIMQLMSIGLFELNMDGSLKLSGGEPIETYTNDDVTGIAKVFTGYEFDFTNIGTTTVQGNFELADPDWVRNPMTSDVTRWRWRPGNRAGDAFHSEAEKSFLGLTIPAGTNAADSLAMALDHLVAHPNVGPFFGKQMIQRLVTSNPSASYVQRVAEVFENNGEGVRGDLRAVFKAILLDEEALSSQGLEDPTFGKLREPMLRFVQLGRTFNMRSVSGDWDLGNASNPSWALAQSPLRAPSVFNFFRPGYFRAGSQSADQDLLAPEFQLVNETSVAGYVNFMHAAVQAEFWPFEDVELDYSTEMALADDSVSLLSHLELLLTANQLTDDVRATILSALDDQPISATSSQNQRLTKVRTAVLLIMTSSDYLVQR